MNNTNYRITIISQYFYPDIATTGQLLLELSLGLVKNNIMVNIVTAFPTYDSNIQAVSKENFNGIQIRRVWSTRFDKNTKRGKIVNSLTFFFSSLLYVFFTNRKSPLLIVSNPPFLPLVGCLCTVLQKRKFVYLVHDVYPDIAIQLGYLSENSYVSKTWKVINRLMLHYASRIVVLSDSMKDIIINKVRTIERETLKTKIEIIHNWADENFIKPVAKEANKFVIQHQLSENFIVLYSGNLGLFHKLETIIEAAKRMNNPKIKFLFIGEGGKKHKLQRMVTEYKLKNVEFYPYVSREELPYSLTSADLAVVSLEKNIEGLAMPSKLYSLMAAGVPIAAFCDEVSDIAKIIHEAQCGYVLNQDDVDGFVSVLNMLVSNPSLVRQFGNNSRKYFESHFTFEQALEKYCKIVKSL